MEHPKNFVILGAGTGGTLAANRLRKMYPESDLQIDVVDQDNDHVYQPGLLFVPFGLAFPDEIVRPRDRQLHDGINYHENPVEKVDIEDNKVTLENGTELAYDALLIATGSVLEPGETEGLTDTGWMESVFSFYDLPGATALAEKLSTFRSGRLVINIIDMPIKCPVAPLEFAFLADWFFTENGVREDISITYVTPLDGAFTKPTASATLAELLVKKNIELVTEFNTGEVDGEAKKLIGYDGTEVEFDLAVVIPLHGGAAYVHDSPGLGDELGFIPTDNQTLQSTVADNVFVLGDAADIPASKAGSVTHFEGEVLMENIEAFLEGKPLEASYDGHANCFIETGFSKALLIDFNYETEPLPGHYPGPVGLPLLKESRLNHIGKLMFQSFYWHGLLQGRDVPGLGPNMPTSGKHTADA
ncbi:MAG: NAD(P)/FAD-dependent oxidoreductase [Acidimicrobiales bacterium]|nr:NAD(P)/FAD-dependent oxidoreductase [Acidimicrobiales bacterium]RZV48603.1 MAG: NAD(P)/FAD-dependent oxidoreductase [Acidimicrobiales bacterium]